MITQPPITQHNFRTFKPSALIERSIADLDTVVANGIAINMAGWFGVYTNAHTDLNEQCYVCLGGAVMAGMEPEIMEKLNAKQFIDPALYIDSVDVTEPRTGIALLFESIRLFEKRTVAFKLIRLYQLGIDYEELESTLFAKWHGLPFHGRIQGDDLYVLKRSIASLVNALKSLNL